MCIQGSLSLSATMVAGQANFHIFVKTDDNTIVSHSTKKFQQVKTDMENKYGIPKDNQELTFAGKQLSDDMRSSDYDIRSDYTTFMLVKLKGGSITGDDIRQAVAAMTEHMRVPQAALQEEQTKRETIKNDFATNSNGVISAIRKGQMKEVSPKKYNNMQTSGNFKM
jgi:hypothetical protein